jgi:hypothetical protein
MVQYVVYPFNADALLLFLLFPYLDYLSLFNGLLRHQPVDHLMGRYLAKPDSHKQVLKGIDPQGLCNTEDFIGFHQGIAHVMPSHFAFKQFDAEFHTLGPLFGLYPLLYPVFGPLRYNKFQPVPAGAMARGCYYLDGIAVFQSIFEGDYLAVDLCANTFMSHLGVDAIRKIDRGRADRHLFNLTFGGEDIDNFRDNLSLYSLKKVHRVRSIFLSLDNVSQPGDIFAAFFVNDPLFLVLPVRCNSLFRYPVHIFGPYLEFHPLAFGAYDSCMQRLVHIGLRDPDIILELPWYRCPQGMYHA